jgi:hypothetical protein
MKRYYSLYLFILSSLVSCGQAITSTDSLGLLALLDYRYKVSIGGTFFGNFNADVKTVPLSADGKCDRTLSGLGTATTDDSGVFKVTYSRTSQSGGYVCVISSPKADGTSRFFAVDRQQSFPWTGDAYNIMILPEPNTTARSQFNVVSTMFNRMATQKLEKLAEGNKDLTRAGTLLKTSNKQIVSQFGLSRGISKSLTKTTLQDALQRVLYSEQRASSIEAAIPDLNDIPIDFSKKDNPVTLKFTVIIGGIQSLADPNDPSSYDKVVSIISKVVASGNKSEAIVFPGGATLSAGGSFGALVSSKVQSFVQSQGAALGLSATEINNIKEEAVQLAAAIDNPPIGSATIDKPLYAVETNTYKIGDKITINPQVAGASGFQITEVCIVTCQPIGTSTSNFIQISSTTGVITGTVPTDIPGDASFQLRISATRSGASTTGVVNLTFRGKPNLSYTGAYLANSGTFDSPVITIGPLPVGYEFSFTPTVIGANSTFTSSGFPTEKCITFSAVTGKISGNFSCITSETSSQVTVTNDIGSKTYSVKFVINKAPSISSVSITIPINNTIGNTLIGSYSGYSDSDGNKEGTPIYSWLRCESTLGDVCTTITSAISNSYTITTADIGKYIQFQVTPVDNLGAVGTFARSQIVQVFNPNQDLVLYMPFNGNFNDESPAPLTQARYNNADTTQPSLVADRRKNPSSNAYSSNRTNYLVMTSADKITSLATNYTMSAWIILEEGISDHGIFSTWNNSSGMIFRVYNYQVQNQNFTCPTKITPVKIPADPLREEWVHVVGVSEGTSAKIYFNGNLCSSGGSIKALPSDYANKWLLVGSDYYPSGYTRTLKGKMDDLRIYNRVLSANEVLSLYNYEK